MPVLDGQIGGGGLAWQTQRTINKVITHSLNAAPIYVCLYFFLVSAPAIPDLVYKYTKNRRKEKRKIQRGQEHGMIKCSRIARMALLLPG